MAGDFENTIRRMEQYGISLASPLNKYGWTALHTACYAGQLELVRYFLEECDGADVNQLNSNGWNSLIFAVYGGHLDVIDFLMFETTVEIDSKDNTGKTAIQIAQEIKDDDILELFNEK